MPCGRKTRAIVEPAFWVGRPRTHVDTFEDYFLSLLGWERFRASQFGIRHFCTMGLNPKEANDARVADGVLQLLPIYLEKPGVVAVGEIGYDDQTPAEEECLVRQLELAREHGLPVLIHTPHRDKKRGASRSMDVILEHGLDPSRVVIDHVNEETVKEVKDRGFYAAFSIYPHSKMTAERMFDILRAYGPERLIVDSACDWGVSDPLSVPKTAKLLAERGIPQDQIRLVTYANALAVYGQSGQMQEDDWLAPAAIDQRTLYQGNTVLRGGQTPKVETARN